MRTTRPTAAAPATAALAAACLLTVLTACGSGGGSGSDADAKSAAGGACASSALGVQVDASAAPAAGDTGNVTVTVTNRGAECTLTGFPSVHLKADGSSAAVAEDKAATAQEVTLAKEGAASFTLTYVRGEAGGAKSLAVTKGEFTLPGSDEKRDFPWSYGEVALKGAGNTPDASVTPFQQTGD